MTIQKVTEANVASLARGGWAQNHNHFFRQHSYRHIIDYVLWVPLYCRFNEQKVTEE